MRKPKEVYWSFLNTADLRQTSGLSFDQARFVASLISKDEIGKWLAWYEGLEKWVPLTEVLQIISDHQAPPMHMPPLPPNNSEIQRGSSAYSEMLSQARTDRRINRRFQKEFAVKLTTVEGELFETETVNISTTGALLRDKVPSSFAKNVRCTISRADGTAVEAFVHILKPTTPERGSRLKFTEISQAKVFYSWLVDSKIR